MFYYLKTNKSILDTGIAESLISASEEFNNISGTYRDHCMWIDIDNDEILLNVGFYEKNGSTHREKYPSESEIEAWRTLFGAGNILEKDKALAFIPTDV